MGVVIRISIENLYAVPLAFIYAMPPLCLEGKTDAKWLCIDVASMLKILVTADRERNVVPSLESVWLVQSMRGGFCVPIYC